MAKKRTATELAEFRVEVIERYEVLDALYQELPDKKKKLTWPTKPIASSTAKVLEQVDEDLQDIAVALKGLRASAKRQKEQEEQEMEERKRKVLTAMGLEDSKPAEEKDSKDAIPASTSAVASTPASTATLPPPPAQQANQPASPWLWICFGVVLVALIFVVGVGIAIWQTSGQKESQVVTKEPAESQTAETTEEPNDKTEVESAQAPENPRIPLRNRPEFQSALQTIDNAYQ